MEVAQIIETSSNSSKPILPEAEITSALIENHDQQNNLPGAKAVTIIATLERLQGRKLTEAEINPSLHQACAPGELWEYYHPSRSLRGKDRSLISA
jgi:hypothetical protein